MAEPQLPPVAEDTPAAGPPAPAPAGPSRRNVWLARGIAAAADGLQLFLFPLFAEGIASPLDVALDLAVAAALVRLIGFHWVLLPGFAAELVPGADLAPTWTGAALIATAGSGAGWKRWLLLAAGAALALCGLAAYGAWRIVQR